MTMKDFLTMGYLNAITNRPLDSMFVEIMRFTVLFKSILEHTTCM